MSRKVLLLAIAAIINSPVTHACSCIPTTVEDEWNEASYVFTAWVDHVEVRPGENFAADHVRFTVLERLKGLPEELPHLVATRSSCGVFMEPGEEWVIATGESGKVSRCGFSRRLHGEFVHETGLHGKMVLQYFRARVANEQSTCVYDQANQIEELMRLSGIEHFRLSGWKAVSADPENLEVVFKRNDGATLEVQRGGCDHLGYSITFRDPNSKIPETEALDIALEQTKYFWDEKERRELKEYVESGQFEVEEGTDARLYTLFHPDLYMTVKYNREDTSVTASYVRTY